MPTLRKIDPARLNGTAATAEPVSCVATAITTAAPSPSSALTGPSGVPGATTSGKRRVGISSRSSRSVAQPPLAASRHCVVVAFVNSVVRLPQSQWWKRSGISSSTSADSSAGSPAAAIAASSYTVLIGSSWIPVRS